MVTRQGTPVWYELMMPDPDGATRFYEGIVGWTVAKQGADEKDYRLISTSGVPIGGMLRLTEEMLARGAQAGWLPYFSVDHLEASVAQATSLGATVFMPPTEAPGAGRFSLMADPQGAAFYIMHADSSEPPVAFERGVVGRCGWNELWTGDVAAALGFYGPLLGFENRETMDMGPMGGYHFIDVGERRLGAVAAMRGQAPRWNAYFTVPDMDRAVERLVSAGGVVRLGPHAVPTGERIVIAADPQGAAFALVSPA